MTKPLLVGMMNVSEKKSLDPSVEGKLNDTDRVTRDPIPAGALIGSIFTKTVYVGAITPFLFAYLGSSSALVSFDAQSQWLVSRLAWIWPVLPIQYELVREVRGVGQSVSYGLMSAALWTWPVICAVAYLRGYVRRQGAVLPLSPQEILGTAVMFPIAVLELIFDPTRVSSPLFGFPVNNTILLYLRQWFLFAAIAFVLGNLFYVLGRIILERS